MLCKSQLGVDAWKHRFVCYKLPIWQYGWEQWEKELRIDWIIQHLMFIYLDSDPIANWSIIFVSNLPANMYSESRGEACDFARVRNACFEQVIFFNCCLTCRSRAFGEEYTSVTWHLFLHSHLPMLVLLVHVACAWVEFAGIKIYHPNCWMDVSWVCQSIHKRLYLTG